MTRCPGISVLLPVRDGGRWLRFAVRDLLAQTGVDLEVLAIDDGSRDRSREVLEAAALEDSRLRVLDGGGAGPAAALNRGLAAARGSLVGQMEADDRCPPDRFARLQERLEGERGWHGVTSRVGQIGQRSPGMRRYLDWQNRLVEVPALARSRFIEIPALHQTGLYRRSFLERLGGYRDDPRWPLDIDFWMRVFEHDGRIGKLPRVLYRWRQHPRQSTRRSPRHTLAALRRCKARYFVGGPGRDRPIWLLSTGRTLGLWREALREAGAPAVEARTLRPGEPVPPVPRRALRLFVYGMERARQRIRDTVELDPRRDWFAA